MIDASNLKIKTKKIFPIHTDEYIEEFCLLPSWKLFVTLSRSFETDRQIIIVYSLPSLRHIRSISFPAFRFETEFSIQFTPDQSAIVIFAHKTIVLFRKEDLIVGVPSIIQNFSTSRQLRMLKNNYLVELQEGVILYKPMKKKFIEVFKISELDLGFAAESIEYLESRNQMIVSNVSRAFNNTLNEGLFALISMAHGKVASKFSFRNLIGQELLQIRPFQLLGSSNQGEKIIVHAESREKRFFIIEINIDEENGMKVARTLLLPDECSYHAKFMTLYEDLNKRSYLLKYFNQLGGQSLLVPMNSEENKTDKLKFLKLSFLAESVLKMVQTNRDSAEFLHLNVDIFSLIIVKI